MNEVISAIINRRCCKNFKAEVPSAELLDQVVEAGTWAPTGMNAQAPIIVKVTNMDVINALRADNNKVGGWTDYDPFHGAPALLIVLSKKDVATHVYDGSIVMQNMMLAADSLGLGTCWIHRAKEVFEMPQWQEWLKSLGVEGEYEGIGHCAIGYRAVDPDPKPRKEGWVFSCE